MTRSAKIGLAGVAVVLLLVVLLYSLNQRSSMSLPPSVAVEHQDTGPATIPSVATLMADPAALAAASKACTNGDEADVMTLCDRVHSAHAQLLAQKYRQGGQ
jgi:hypothetical protein